MDELGVAADTEAEGALPATRSSADEGEIELYARGSCHAFAVALHRRLGFGFLVVTDPGSPYWEDEADADNFVPSVTHVLAVDAEGTAWDVLGARPADAAEAECRARHWDVVDSDSDAFPGEEGLSTYVDGMGEDDVDRPLHALSDADVDEAWDCARRVLAGLPGFPEPGPRP